MNESTSSNDSYLALVPRGLQHAAHEAILEQLSEYQVHLEVVGEAVTDAASHVSRLAGLLREQKAKGRGKNGDIENCFGGSQVGSIKEGKKDFSIGYMEQSNPVWACPGVLHGVVWLKIETNAPTEIISKHLRCLGPVISLVNVWEKIDMPSTQSLEESVSSITSLVDSIGYARMFKEALSVWFNHVKTSWGLAEEDLKILGEKINGSEAMKYRLSCIRSDSDKYQYTRQQFLAKVADVIIPEQQESTSKPWKVDLTKYDVEIVLLVHPTGLAVGMALRPYQHLGVKSFAAGAIPPDVSSPVLPSEVLASVIRLRPTTAQLLLQLAKIEPGDLVLDPCSGVGTIPIEVAFQRKDAIALGGDLALTEDGLGPVAAGHSKKAHAVKQDLYPASARFADQMAWDATCLPLRDETVDVVVSDLPFGVQCLSKAKLDTVLPLMLSELARVLRRGTGRIVLLCGSYIPVVKALQQLNRSVDDNHNSEEIMTMPCHSVFPVNIGGLLAWIVIAKRGCGRAREIANYKERVRKATKKRERIERCQSIEKAGKKRGKLQS